MLTILYQDRDLVVCVKPAGVLSQDAGEKSMPGMLREQLGVREIYVIHRLDQEVGGVMVFGLTAKAAACLSRAVQEHTFRKTYLAVLQGVPEEPQAELTDLLFHDQRRNKTYVVNRLRKGVKEARLSYRVLAERQGHALAEVELHTGRTHQIRVQFASRKLPLTGDRKYGGKAEGKRLGLWSRQLEFPHPNGKIMRWQQLPPDEEPWTMFRVTEGQD